MSSPVLLARRALADTGLSVSELCLGTMQFKWTATLADSFRVLDAYAEAGGNFIDTADVYTRWIQGLKGGEAETVIGGWMKDRGNRKDIILATKVRGRMWDGQDGEGLGRAHILKSCEASLKRLRTDYIDLYQSHWPDAAVSHEETLEAYALLRSQGKVRFIGCSNFGGADLAAALAVAEKTGITYRCVQPEYSLVWRSEFESSVLPAVKKHKLAVIPYSPLAAGFLTGKYRADKPLPKSGRLASVQKDYMSGPRLLVLEVMDSLSKRTRASLPQLALAWLLSREWITAPIIGANTVAQLTENLGASGLKLSADDVSLLDQASAGL